MKRLIERMERKSTCLLEDMATWEDFRKQMEEETGIAINVRESNGKIYLTGKK